MTSIVNLSHPYVDQHFFNLLGLKSCSVNYLTLYLQVLLSLSLSIALRIGTSLNNGVVRRIGLFVVKCFCSQRFSFDKKTSQQGEQQHQGEITSSSVCVDGYGTYFLLLLYSLTSLNRRLKTHLGHTGIFFKHIPLKAVE